MDKEQELKIELYDIIERQSALSYKIQQLEQLKKDKIAKLNEFRSKSKEHSNDTENKNLPQTSDVVDGIKE